MKDRSSEQLLEAFPELASLQKECIHAVSNPLEDCTTATTLSATVSFDKFDPIVIAGPCALESYEQTLEIALAVKAAGAKIFRGSAYKPRTSPYSFQGRGKDALIWHKRAQAIHGLLTETEVTSPQLVELCAEHVDILRIGMRNMQNFALLEEVGKTGKPVILKRSACATLKEWLLAAEYILKENNSGPVILCERGIRTFESSMRYTLDFGTALIAKEISNLPVIIDPSHAAGHRKWVVPLAQAALALGVDGVMVEVHPYPEKALSDSKQQISLEELSKITHSLKKMQFCN
ncbi:3-deoxy-7-phosphoheptulonate synthase [Chlamydiifrater phoenicopteri]|uniref:3-deoxy-7-phosphoheptulonate synthase n=1 Tax=Chlamydiifrater phoenicopteri TaxID=2681469 RepID=UPI001BD12856|nr:3-deoxy-7-phosphoheptulonate synthase [Chlamydiifrater phoenicopteri]